MSVVIKPMEDPDTYEVNGKLVVKDMNQNWLATEELTPSESKCFREYLKAKESKD